MNLIQLHILPAPLYIESICRNEVCIDRLLLHLVVHNRMREAIQLHKMEIAFINTCTSSALIHRFEGKSLESMLLKSAPMLPKSGTAGTTILPDGMGGIASYYAEVDGEHCFDQVQCVICGCSANGTSFQQSVQTALRRDLPQTVLSLPVKGRWWVAGGHLPFEPHRRGRLQASTYGYDFVRLGADCRSYHSEGTKNDDYYAYGAAVLAAADGVVIHAEATHSENCPGQRLSESDADGSAFVPMPGNHVVLQHQPGEFTFYAHLQSRLRVNPGEAVSRGQVLGRVGNSGESTEPHLHFHFANGPDLQATGLPVVFHNWKEDAFCISPNVLEQGIMLSGEIIESAEV